MTAYDFEKLRVLAIDDNRFTLSVIKSLLDTMGVKTVFCMSKGTNALEIMKQWQPDVLIVDQVMQPISGLDLIRQIRDSDSDKYSFVPIVLVTAHASKEVVHRARFWAGADAVLVKPLSARRLFNCIVALYESDRTFVRTGDYFGPDRRVKDRPFEGEGRRAEDPAQDKPEGAAVAAAAADDGDLLFIGVDDDADEPPRRASA